MSKIEFLLKFGERQYMERLQQGHLFFSNAKKFRETEEKLFIKGQGDKLEGGSVVAATNIKMSDYNTGIQTDVLKNVNLFIHYPDAEKIPVFCLFACDSNDCVRNSDGSLAIRLSGETIRTIGEHFPDADTVAIINNPDCFIQNVCDSIGTECKADLVHYFNVIPQQADNGQLVNDMEYHKYLSQDTPPERVDGRLKYSFCVDYIYRVLQCKDKFFEKEQEYRFILPKIEIEEPKEFDVHLKTTDIELQNLNAFFANMS